MIADEQAQLQALLGSLNLPEPVAQAIESRRVQLDSIENAARTILEEASAAIDDNRAVEARAILIALMERNDTELDGLIWSG